MGLVEFPWEWESLSYSFMGLELAWEWLDGNGGNENSIFSHL